MHFYQFDINKYRAATGHLTVEEHGIYRWLLDETYHTESPLSTDIQQYVRKIRLTSDQKETLVDILNEFFVLEEDGWHNLSAEEALAVVYAKSEKAKESADIRWKKEKRKANASKKNATAMRSDANAMRPQCEGDAKAMRIDATHYPLPITHNSLPITHNSKPNGSSKELVEQKPDPVAQVFQYWQETFKHPKAALDKKRGKFIRDALKLYSIYDCTMAIQGCSLTPHNIGDNDRGQRYDGIHIVFKDADQIDRFIANAKNPPTGAKTVQQSIDKYEAQGQRLANQFGVTDG